MSGVVRQPSVDKALSYSPGANIPVSATPVASSDF